MPASDAGSRPAAPSPYLVASAAISAGEGGGDDGIALFGKLGVDGVDFRDRASAKRLRAGSLTALLILKWKDEGEELGNSSTQQTVS